MTTPLALNTQPVTRPPIAILGVPFDNVTKVEAIKLVEEMIGSGRPHYLVTPNVDFLAQARKDVELRRILFEAHLVLCDGTPLVWASKLLGNPLPERVAGADLVPLLIEVAARKGYRLFLLGASPESAQRAVARLQKAYPDLTITGHYSPPFNELLEMDHEEIKRRIKEAKPDLLFVSFGCPKQEKWVAMHYRALGVPVTAGVGATIDFLAGHVKRAPLWMQRGGVEWLFRLAQEPRRLFRRYLSDLWIFGTSILPQWWQLRSHRRSDRDWMGRGSGCKSARLSLSDAWCRLRLPVRLDVAAVRENAALVEQAAAYAKDCVVEMNSTHFIDSTGVGFLIRLRKRVLAEGRELVLLAPSPVVVRALSLMRLGDFFLMAPDEAALWRLLHRRRTDPLQGGPVEELSPQTLRWHGEVTAANADAVWEYTRKYLAQPTADHKKIIDLSQVRFIDSTGLGLMIRAKKLSLQREENLLFAGLQKPVRNVVRLSRVEDFLLGPGRRESRSVLSLRR